MDAVVAALADQQAELDGLIDGLGDEGWRRPSPCEGWDVAAVVLHVAQTNEMAVGSAEGRFAEVLYELTDGIGPAEDIDAGAALMVERDRDDAPATILERWRASVASLQQALLVRDPSDRVTWVAGELSARTLATTRIAETWIHTTDVAAALDVELVPSERLWHIARLAWRTIPYAFARAGQDLIGPVAFALRGPDGQAWDFVPDTEPLTTIEGDALDLCRVAGRRVDPAVTSLKGSGPDTEAVLALVRTYA